MPPPDKRLVGDSAEFIVETPLLNGRELDLPAYSSVSFTDAMAGTSGGKMLYPSNGEPIPLVRNHQTLSQGEITGFNTVQCTYTGPP